MGSHDILINFQPTPPNGIKQQLPTTKTKTFVIPKRNFATFLTHDSLVFVTKSQWSPLCDSNLLNGPSSFFFSKSQSQLSFLYSPKVNY